jgi:hypothetical protein
MSNDLTEERFLQDVAEHKMTVLRDEGYYRHVRFQEPGTGVLQFDLVTWPGYLCYCGDMGEFVFRRIPDMFVFFRTDRPGIQPDFYYWKQKCVAADRDGGIENYSPNKFISAVNQCLDDAEASDAVRRDAKYMVLSRADDGEHAAMDAALEFRSGNFRLEAFWECNLKEPSYRFVWACYAIAWGVQHYDAAKQTEIT